MDARRNIRMAVEYDGSRFVGWQRQANGVGVQEALEEALGAHLRQRIVVNASGRTDSGVHALGQVINFRTSSNMALAGIWRGVLALLPEGIEVVDAAEAPAEFDARRDARMRWYRYFLIVRDTRPAVGAQFVTHVVPPVDVKRMQAAAEVLAGKHDFRAFRASTCEGVRTVLTLQPIVMTKLENSILQIDFRCRSFLQNMVRILAGVMVAHAKGKMSLQEVREMVEGGVRHQYAATLAPNGLFL